MMMSREPSTMVRPQFICRPMKPQAGPADNRSGSGHPFFAAILFLTFTAVSIAEPFVPDDTVLAGNVFQVEFSDDFRSMVWCEQIAVNKAKVWYADVDLTTGLPDFANKQGVDTIQGQGWPYWGHDVNGRLFLIMNQHRHLKLIRRNGVNDLTAADLGTVNADTKSMLNVSSDSTRPYVWINYIVKSAVSGVKDSLFAFRSDNPSTRVFIDAEVPNAGGSAYELTFPRWMAQSQLLAYPFRPDPARPYWDMRFWDGASATSRQVTDDIQASFLNHHVDDYPFRVPQFPSDTFMFSSKAASSIAIYKKQGQYFSLIEHHQPLTAISPLILTSFEPFSVRGKTYGAYQVYQTGGSVIPGSTPGEIWLKGIFGDSTQYRISEGSGVAVDPEFVIGKDRVWIYYYGKPVGQQTFDLHRCETGLRTSASPVRQSLDAQRPKSIARRDDHAYNAMGKRLNRRNNSASAVLMKPSTAGSQRSIVK